MEHTEPDHEAHDEAADAFEHETDQLQRESDQLGSDIDEARKDWEAKRRDPGVPGAVAPDPDDGENPSPAAGDGAPS